MFREDKSIRRIGGKKKLMSGERHGALRTNGRLISSTKHKKHEGSV